MDYAITDEEFRQISALVYQESGISLPEHKKALVVSRLSRRLRELGLETFQSYYDYVLGGSDGDELIRMLDLISTNKTSFFREPVHFEFLRDRILPGLESLRRIRIWSSACSTGEEPYSIAMTVYDGVKGPDRWDCKILASDLSTTVLEKAALGVYDLGQVSDLSRELLRRHFLRGCGSHTRKVKVKPHLARMIVFRRINLMDDLYPIKAPLDVIYCRNVLIYFDRQTQGRLMAKFDRYLKSGGYLFLGHSETLQWVGHRFRYMAPTIYRKES